MGKGFNLGGIGNLFGGGNSILPLLLIVLFLFNDGSRE